MGWITFPRSFYGMSFEGPNQTGGLDGPMIDGAFAGTGDFVSDLSTLKTQGARVVLKPCGAPGNYQNTDLSFNFSMWKTKMDQAAAKTNAKQMGSFFQGGTLIGINIVDDAKAGSTIFGGVPPTLAEVDSMAAYSKSKWSMVPTVVRIDNIYLKQKSDWTNLDFAWCQWHERFGNAQTWLTNCVNDGRSVGLGTLAAFNLLNGGSGITAPWNQSPNQAGDFGMSPQEIDRITNTVSAQSYIIGALGWSANPQFDPGGYYNYPSVQTALQRLANVCAIRQQGPLNWREHSPSGSTDTSGSTQTIVGNWAVTDTGVTKRKNDPVDIQVLRPVDGAGNFQGLLLYSRDSSRSFIAPSGWSTAKSISGNSAQGGQLMLCYKLGVASEVDVTVTLSGNGGTGNSLMGRWFSFSANTSTVGNLLGNAGSANSWTSQTGMGVIPGITSTKSDALVLICAARANDFGGGSTDENVMSATTGPETWNRLFSTGNSLGEDSGMFVDWAATSGLASVTSKSWSQTSGTQAGAGCGFMVAFAPASVVSGQPAVFNSDIEDVALSVGSNLSFTLQSLGSTPFTYSKTSGPSNVTLGSSTGAFQFTPVSSGIWVVGLSVSNSFGSDNQTFSVTASSPGGGGGDPGGGGSGSTQTGTNSFPVITNPGNKTIQAHDLLSFMVVATDVDEDALTWGLDSGSPAGAHMVPDSGQFVWIPAGNQGPGTYPITVLVTDGVNESRSTFTVTVTDTAWTRDRGPSSQFGQTNPVTNSFIRI